MNLDFDRGTELDDPDKRLAGTGKLIRHIRLKSTAETRTPAVVRLIEQAVDQGRAMAEAKGESAQPIVVVKRRQK